MPANMNAASGIAWQTYLSVADDVKPWVRVEATNAAFDAALAEITAMACDWVQTYLGRPIAPTQFDWRFDGWSGWNGAYIELPYSPVLEITSVVEYWGISGPHNLVESQPTAQVDGWQCEYLTGRLTRVFPGLVQKPWFPGSRNIEVKWTAGYNPVPPTVRMATLEFIAHWFRNTQQKTGGRPVANNEEGSSGMFAGVPYRITALLEPMLQVGIG